jgi:hypothetical protein
MVTDDLFFQNLTIWNHDYNPHSPYDIRMQTTREKVTMTLPKEDATIPYL